jgi:hypothetical protein
VHPEGTGAMASWEEEEFDFYQRIVAAIPTTATTAICVYHFLLYNW